MKDEILRFGGAQRQDPAIDEWVQSLGAGPRDLVQRWRQRLRDCGEETRELWHDGCAVVCLGDAPFAYVGAYRAHVSIGFYQGAALPDPAAMLEGTGKRMRHVKIRLSEAAAAGALEDRLNELIRAAYTDMKRRVGEGS